MAIQQRWFVYQTTNVATGAIYVGVHFGTEDDKYIGSGVVLKRAVKKYGRLSFMREIVKCCDSVEEAYELEELIVDSDFVDRHDTYNLALGGRGHDGRNNSEETILKMRKPKSEAHRAAISKGKTGKKLSQAHRDACARGRLGSKRSEQTRSKMSRTRTNKVHQIVQCPHCGKEGGAPAMGQWHFNNCKFKE